MTHNALVAEVFIRHFHLPRATMHSTLLQLRRISTMPTGSATREYRSSNRRCKQPFSKVHGTRSKTSIMSFSIRLRPCFLQPLKVARATVSVRHNTRPSFTPGRRLSPTLTGRGAPHLHCPHGCITCGKGVKTWKSANPSAPLVSFVLGSGLSSLYKTADAVNSTICNSKRQSLSDICSRRRELLNHTT